MDNENKLRQIFSEPLEQYLTEKDRIFAGNKLANKFRHDFPSKIRGILSDEERYKIRGSAGQSKWTDCPWIAILDVLITQSPQTGYYPVYLFKSDMTGIYLSLNQGVTEVKQDYKRDAKNVLQIRAEDYRGKLEVNRELLTQINLQTRTSNGKLYEAGNIFALYYPASALPDGRIITDDLKYFLHIYEELAYSDNTQVENAVFGYEKKQMRLHLRIERNAYLAKKVKKIKGYRCEGCEMTFTGKYGSLGTGFIEVHHMTPISTVSLDTFKVNLKDDFAVLCSNCHSMIHRLSDSSDLHRLRKIVKSHAV